MLLRSQKTSAEMEQTIFSSHGAFENRFSHGESGNETRNSNTVDVGDSVNSVHPVTSPLPEERIGDVCLERTSGIRRNSFQESGSQAAGIAVPHAMNAAASAAHITSGSVSNRIEPGSGDCISQDCNVHQIQAQNSIKKYIPLIQNSSNFHQIHHFGPEEISIMLPSFAGASEEDVNHFVAVLENTKNALKVNEFIMKLVIIRNLKGKALSWLHSQADFMLKSYDEILKNLKEFFDRPVNTFEIRKRLENRTWSPKFETFSDYCQAKKVIAQHLKMPES